MLDNIRIVICIRTEYSVNSQIIIVSFRASFELHSKSSFLHAKSFLSHRKEKEEKEKKMAAPQAERKPLPSRNPLFVSSAQEAQIRETYYQRVRGHCADEIRGTPPPTNPLYLSHQTPSSLPSPKTPVTRARKHSPLKLKRLLAFFFFFLN